MIARTLSFKSLSREELITVSKNTIFQTTNLTSKIFIEIAKTLSKIMSSSKGRKKICGVIQYLAKLKYYCTIHSNIPELRIKFLAMNKRKKLISGKIEETMSKNKKIFKFLRFVDEFYKLTQILAEKKKFDKLLANMMVLSRLTACIYFLLDNFLWAVNTGMLSDLITDEKYKGLKYVKNTSSFWRNIFAIILDVFKYKYYKKKERNLTYRFRMAGEGPIKKDSEAHKIFKELIGARSKSRISTMEVVHSCLRLGMLWKDLKYPQSQYLNPIFVAFIGNVSQWISLLKFSILKQKFENKTLDKGIVCESSKKIVKSRSKKRLMRSLSSVFRQVDEPHNSNGGESWTGENDDDNSLTDSFLMPMEVKKTKVQPKRLYYSSKSIKRR